MESKKTDRKVKISGEGTYMVRRRHWLRHIFASDDAGFFGYAKIRGVERLIAFSRIDPQRGTVVAAPEFYKPENR